VDGRIVLGTGIGIGISGPTTAPGEKRCVPTSEEVVALEKEDSCDDAEISAEEEEEFEVEKSMRRACGEGVGGEEADRGDEDEGTGKCRVGTLRDLLLLCEYDLDFDLNIENLDLFRGERIGNAEGGCGSNVGSISRLEERDRRLFLSLSFPTFEEPANTPK
jgi:hypothetical protein